MKIVPWIYIFMIMMGSFFIGLNIGKRHCTIEPQIIVYDRTFCPRHISGIADTVILDDTLGTVTYWGKIKINGGWVR